MRVLAWADPASIVPIHEPPLLWFLQGVSRLPVLVRVRQVACLSMVAWEVPPLVPPPHTLADTEYVLCALCHTVLPVPPVDLAFLREHGKPTNRVVSHSSDATVKDNRPKRRIKDDEDETSTVLTTTDPQAEIETRKSLVLAHHNAHDTEHARRLRFPRFKEAWERRMKKQAALDGNLEPEEEEPEQEHEQPAQPGPQTVLSPGQVFASPSQVSLSSLSASPSVAVMGLDGEDVYETYGRALKAFDKRSEVGAPPPPPPPPPKRDDDNESLVDWESRLKNTESPPPPQAQPQFAPRAPSTRSISSASTTYTYDSMGRRYARDETGRAFPVDADGRIIVNGSPVPVQIPSNLLPSLSPMTHSTGLDSEPDRLSLDERGFREPGPPPPLPGRSSPSVPPKFKEPGPPPPLARPAPRNSSPAQMAKPRTSSPLPPKPASPAPKFSPAAKPVPFNHPPPPRPPSAPIPRRSVSVSSAGQSQPYVPSPSPPPRLAFDTYGRVLKLGMLGWERDMSGALQLGPRSETSETESRPMGSTSSLPASSVRASSVPASSIPASSVPPSETSSHPEVEEESEPPRSPTPEPEPEPEPERGRVRAPSPIGTEVGVPRGVATVSAPQRYTLIPGKSEASVTSSPPPSTTSHTRSSSSLSMRSGGVPQLPPTQLGFGGVALNFGTTLEKGLALGLETVPTHLASTTAGGSISRPAHGRSASASQGMRSSSAQPSFRAPEPVRSFSVSQPVRTTITPARTESQLASQPQPARGSTFTQTSNGTASFTPPSLLQSTGPTTRTTRPVVARKSTGEWTRLEGGEGDAGLGGWKNRTQTPEVLAEEEPEAEPTSESEGDKSHSEASQLIREFTGKSTKTGVASGGGTARVISRTSTLPARTRPVSSSPTPLPAPQRNPSSSSIHANESIYGTTSRQHPARSFDPTPASSRAFSPSAAWNTLRPASPRSQSTQSDGYGVDEFGSFEAPGLDQSVEVQPFDEKGFLADLGFGITIPTTRPRSLSEGSSERSFVQGTSPARVQGKSPSSKGKSPVSSKGKSPASTKGKSPASTKGKSPVQVQVRSPSPSEEASDEEEEESLPPSPVNRRASAPVHRPLAGPSAPRQSLPAPVPAPAPTRAQTPPPITPVRSAPQTSPPSAQVIKRVTIRDPDPISKSSTPVPKPLSSTPMVGPSTPAPRTPIDKPSIFARASPPSRGPIARARAPSPLQRQVQAMPPPPPPIAAVPAHIAASIASPAPQTPESPNPKDVSPKPVLKTRRRARPMGSSVAGSVVSGYGRYAGSVVSGYEREGSVVSGANDEKSVVSERVDAESEVGVVRPPVTLPPSLQLRALELLSPSSDAPSSVVTPLSPGIVQALQARGISVDEPIAEEQDQDVEAIAQHLAGVNLREMLGSPEPMSIEIVGRVDTDSGFTSPVAPPGAPSDAGSLFSRVVSPKLAPTVARLSTIRSDTPASTRTKTPPVTPPKASQVTPPKVSHLTRVSLNDTPKSQRSARPESSTAPRLDSLAATMAQGKGKGHGPSSVFSRGPESSYSSHEEKPKVEWKLELPHHTADPPITFQSLLGGMESTEQGHLGLDSAAMRAGEDPNAEPDSEPLTPTSSAPRASQKALREVLSHEQQGEEEEYDEVDPEEASGEEEEVEEDGRLTSSEEEGARTETADDDGLDHLTESVGEPFGLQAQADALPHMEASFDTTRAQHGNMLGSGPLYDSPRLVSPPPLPEGFDTQFVDHRVPQEQPPMTPNEMEVFQTYGGEMTMPEEVLALQPVMCDACRAPMAAAKWYEHVSRSGHRRNAAHYAQWKFEHLTARYPDVDRRELWAQATRLDPRGALPTEYAFCEVCQVFLIRGDTDHFEGKKHLKCLKAIALRDADELESVRGSVSEEEDEPPYRPPMLASQRGVDWTQPRARSTAGASSALGHRAFPSGN
ncbi:hypothetical protein OPQ81_010490 [Rhizoctonia solani]|nr:hypothetical protein OPQ81_010490 [Rhizoctonia solani]